jgi:hypothetical protein
MAIDKYGLERCPVGLGSRQIRPGDGSDHQQAHG